MMGAKKERLGMTAENTAQRPGKSLAVVME
jgi:hypothetical protein